MHGSRELARDAGEQLVDVQYVVLTLSGEEPQLSLYPPEGSDPPYVTAPPRR